MTSLLSQKTSEALIVAGDFPSNVSTLGKAAATSFYPYYADLCWLSAGDVTLPVSLLTTSGTAHLCSKRTSCNAR